MFVQSIIFGCLECVYTSIFLISSSEVHPLPVLVIFFFSQLLLLVLILRSSRIYCSCSKPRISDENSSNISENKQEKDGVHIGESFELDKIAKNQDFEMIKEEQKDSTQVYKDNDIELEHIPILENSKLFKLNINSKIEEETKGQSNNRGDSLSKDTDCMNKKKDSSQEDDFCNDLSYSNPNDFNKNESSQVLDFYLRSRAKTSRRSHQK